VAKVHQLSCRRGGEATREDALGRGRDGSSGMDLVGLETMLVWRSRRSTRGGGSDQTPASGRQIGWHRRRPTAQWLCCTRRRLPRERRHCLTPARTWRPAHRGVAEGGAVVADVSTSHDGNTRLQRAPTLRETDKEGGGFGPAPVRTSPFVPTAR
jgi:hypothetical protein